jgi:hypothetical protein
VSSLNGDFSLAAASLDGARLCFDLVNGLERLIDVTPLRAIIHMTRETRRMAT